MSSQDFPWPGWAELEQRGLEVAKTCGKYAPGYCCGVRAGHAGGSGQMLIGVPSNQTVDQVEVRGDQRKFGGEDESPDFFLFLWREKL